METSPQGDVGADLVALRGGVRGADWLGVQTVFSVMPFPSFVKLGTRREGERMGNTCKGNQCGLNRWLKDPDEAERL